MGSRYGFLQGFRPETKGVYEGPIRVPVRARDLKVEFSFRKLCHVGGRNDPKTRNPGCLRSSPYLALRLERNIEKPSVGA